MADVLETMLIGLRDALERGDRRRIAETKRLDDGLDRLNTSIKEYLTGLDPEAMTEADHLRATDIFAFATNLEHAGDVVERNLLGLAVKKAKRGVAFSPEVQAQLLAVIDRLIADLRAAASLFTTGDVRIARMLVAEKEAFRDIEARAAATHFERLRAGELSTAGASSMHLDLLRDLKRVGSHVVTAAAYQVLEVRGELLPSRLRQPDEIGSEANPSEGDEQLS